MKLYSNLHASVDFFFKWLKVPSHKGLLWQKVPTMKGQHMNGNPLFFLHFSLSQSDPQTALGTDRWTKAQLAQ